MASLFAFFRNSSHLINLLFLVFVLLALLLIGVLYWVVDGGRAAADAAAVPHHHYHPTCLLCLPACLPAQPLVKKRNFHRINFRPKKSAPAADTFAVSDQSSEDPQVPCADKLTQFYGQDFYSPSAVRPK